MHYFLTNKFEYNLSGIEHAQLYRWRMFTDLKVESKIITFDFTPELDRFLFRHGIGRSLSLNMFDCWQNVLQSAIQENEFENDFPNLRLRFEYYGPRTTPNYLLSKNKIKLVQYFDDNQQLMTEDHWDIRGFRSLRLDFSDGNIIKRSWYDLDGNVVLTEINGQLTITEHNPQFASTGNNTFTSWQQLKVAWLDFLVSRDNDAVLYIDRAEYVTPIVLAMENKAVPVYIILHSAHTKDRNDPMGAPFNEIRQLEIDRKERWSAYIASTPQQAKDFEVRSGIKTYTIPVSQVSQTAIPLAQKPKSIRNLVYTSRISREKRIEDAIYAVEKLVKKYPDIKLRIYGYVTDGEYNKELYTMIKRLQLEENVYLLPYQVDRTDIFSQADIFILTSEYEGFNMSMLEAAAYGVPTVAYDVKYGPAHLNEQLKTGALVESGNIDALAKQINALIEDDEGYKIQQSQSQAQAIKQFGSKVVGQKWQNFLEKEALIRESRRWVYDFDFSSNHNALAPANLAIGQYAQDEGFSPLSYPEVINMDRDSKLENINMGDIVLTGYPSFYKTMPTVLQYDLDLARKIKQMGAKLIMLVEDSLSLRELTNFVENELATLNVADILMVLTEQMKGELISLGIKTPILVQSPYPLPKGNISASSNYSGIRTKEILYSGNLTKAPFLESIAVEVDVFGPRISEKMRQNYKIRYHGSVPFSQLMAKLRDFRGFGLVWDGGDVPIKTDTGRYTRYNFPYKASQYLALEMPLIAWSGSAISGFILEHNCGILINNMSELKNRMEQLSQQEISNMAMNAKRLSKMVTEGTSFKSDLNRAISWVQD
ncbi:glycosyltransferase [Weissella muntiaci]|uniref:Glycosyltransferase n=1 Tax=Weissella muntiaci TaxID=2508881 RepID=A0A6C2C391_9LACO|nr:glycosyltransferase [Weissella muntiaci]TYC48344.1 glycosyltransferase [Weissella muntiaci]